MGIKQKMGTSCSNDFLHAKLYCAVILTTPFSVHMITNIAVSWFDSVAWSASKQYRMKLLAARAWTIMIQLYTVPFEGAVHGYGGVGVEAPLSVTPSRIYSKSYDPALLL